MARETKYSEGKSIGLIGGRLTVIEDLGVFNKSRRVKAKCECGSIIETNLYNITSGQSKSCGCFHKELLSKLFKERVTTHGLSSHPLYGIWSNIKRRCRVPGSESYDSYGAVGVDICEEWHNDFKLFYDWCIENGWERGMEVDKDLKSLEKPGKLYSTTTCAIVTTLENVRNRGTTQFIEYNGENLSVQEWAERLNIHYKVVWQRLKNGWTLDRMMQNPGLVEHSNILNYRGKSVGITELARRFGISVGALKKRLKKGWSVEKAVETPLDTRYITNKKAA